MSKKKRNKKYTPKQQRVQAPQKPPIIIFNLFGTSTKTDQHHAVVEKVDRTPDGQPLTKLQGCSYLYKGYPDSRIMEQLDVSKDASWIMADILRKKIILPFAVFSFIFLKPIAKRIFLNVCDKYFKIAYDPLTKKKWIPPYGKEYCTPIRELYRVSQEMISEIENKRMRSAFNRFRDLFLMVFEMDTAYRFKLQDVLPTINKENLKKNPIQEINKAILLIRHRETSADQKAKWNKIRKPLIFILRFRKKTRNQIIRFLSTINYEKIAIDESDWYFCLERQDYNYRGINIDDRREERRKIDKEKHWNSEKDCCTIPIITIEDK